MNKDGFEYQETIENDEDKDAGAAQAKQKRTVKFFASDVLPLISHEFELGRFDEPYPSM